MKIVRNGNEFELTKDELYTAYLEQEHEFDRDTCLCYIDEHLATMNGMAKRVMMTLCSWLIKWHISIECMRINI